MFSKRCVVSIWSMDSERKTFFILYGITVRSISFRNTILQGPHFQAGVPEAHSLIAFANLKQCINHSSWQVFAEYSYLICKSTWISDLILFKKLLAPYKIQGCDKSN